MSFWVALFLIMAGNGLLAIMAGNGLLARLLRHMRARHWESHL